MLKYSIAIPAFKAKFIKECIDSILGQSYENWELIIVNDASPEDIDSIVSKYDDKRISYYKNEFNCGSVNVVDNWNKCLSYSSGDYLILMGDDDFLSQNCLLEYNKLIEKYPNLSVYHGRTTIVDENSDFIRLQEARPEYESVFSLIWHRLNGRAQFIGDFLFKIEDMKTNRGFYKLPLAWGSDDISSYIACAKSGIANTNTPIFNYRENRQTITLSGNPEIKIQAVYSMVEWISDFVNKTECVDSVDEKLKVMIKGCLKGDIKKKHIYIIATTIKQRGPFAIIKWFRCRKKYNLSTSLICYSFIEGLRFRYHRS